MKRRIVSKAFIFILLAACAPLLLAQKRESGLVVQVSDYEGRPLKNACVTVIPKEGEITLIKADSKGRVRLKRLAKGSYRVVVRIDGYEAQKKQVSIGDQPETVAFSLQPRRVGE